MFCGNSIGRGTVWHGGCLILAAALGLGELKAENLPSKPRRAALLVAIGNYKYLTNLAKYTKNDVERLRYVLAECGDYRVEVVTDCLSNEDTANSAAKSGNQTHLTREILEESISEKLKAMANVDVLLLYLSLHGFRGDDGNLYLAAFDCDPGDLEEAKQRSLSADWLAKQLEQCEARVKLLVIDACHSVPGKSLQLTERQIDPATLARSFESIEGVFWLASCKPRQVSYVWKEREQSLFSYWLTQGLKGHADADGSGDVTLDEIYQFVHRGVMCVTKGDPNMFSQEPTRIVNMTTPGNPVLIQLKPFSLSALLSELADQLSVFAEVYDAEQIRVLEFVGDSVLRERSRTTGWNFRVLYSLCGTQLAVTLHSKLHRNAEKCEIASKILQNGTPVTIARDGSLVPDHERATGSGGRKLAIAGAVRGLTGDEILLECTLIDQETSKLLCRAVGKARLTAEEWAMLGVSFLASPEDYNRPFRMVGQTGILQDTIVISRWEKQARKPHPMSNKSCPYRVYIVVDGEPLTPTFIGNRAYVPLRPGDIYEIWVENHTEENVFLKLLVDGRSTLPRAVKCGKNSEEINWEPACISRLKKAVAWELEPARRDGNGNLQPPVYAIRGFFSSFEGKYRRFRVEFKPKGISDGSEGATDAFAMITAAFYKRQSVEEYLARLSRRRSALVTVQGEEGEEQLMRYNGPYVPGELAAVLHFNYVPPSFLESLRSQPNGESLQGTAW